LPTTTTQSTAVVWIGTPWITLDAVARTILVIVLGAIIVWLENLDNAASSIILAMPVWTWTAIVFFAAWVLSLIPLFLLRAAHRYTLRSDSLEVKTGIASLKSFVLSPSGFSDLEIDQSILGRIVNFGDITVHTQSDRTARMQKVRDPSKVAGLIREYMGKPVVRIDNAPSNSP
jgi:membrane protein YdbS with pleckstrin-like domain